MKNQMIVFIALVFVAVVGMNQTVTAETLVAAWDFNVAVGSNSVPDLSGNGFDLTIGTAGAIETGGKFGNCLTNTLGQDANAAGQVGYVPGSVVLGSLIDDAFKGAVTVEAWIRLDSFETRNSDDEATFFHVGGRANNEGDQDFFMKHRSGSNALQVLWDDGTRNPYSLQSASSPLSGNRWTHVAYTRAADGTVRIWRNGVKIKEATGATWDDDGFNVNPTHPAFSNPQLDLLAPYNFDGADAIRMFPGSIDFVRIWSGVKYTAAFTPPVEGFTYLFMQQSDIYGEWGNIYFASNSLINDSARTGLDYCDPLVSVEQRDGSWMVYGVKNQSGSLYPFKAKTTDGYTYTDLSTGTFGGSSLNESDVLQYTMAYDGDDRKWLFLYGDLPFRDNSGVYNDGFDLHAMTATDGLTFTTSNPNALYLHHDALHAMWDPVSDTYLNYQILYQELPSPKEYPDNIDEGRRVIAVKDSVDGYTWTPDWSNTTPYTLSSYADRRIEPDSSDSPCMEFYWFTAFPYEDRYIGISLLYEPSPRWVNPREPNVPNAHGPYLATEWWASSDGYAWERPFQNELLGLEPDRKLGFYANRQSGVTQCSPVIIGDKAVFQRRGYMPKHRFGGAAAGANAKFMTKTFVMPRTPLYLNATALYVNQTLPGDGNISNQNDQAYIMVELVDENGVTITNYNRQYCRFQDVDGLHLPLVWDDGSTQRDGTELAGGTYRLLIFLRDARIYAVTTEAD